MTDVSPLSSLVARYREHAATALAPFLVPGKADPNAASVDDAALLSAARELLAGYDARMPREIQLVTQLLATSLASLACLGGAAAAGRQSVKDMLALQDSALALQRVTRKAEKALAACRKNRASPANLLWDEGTFQLTINKALEVMHRAMAAIDAHMPPAPVAAPPAAEPPMPKPPKLLFQYAEPMTYSVLQDLARLARQGRERPN